LGNAPLPNSDGPPLSRRLLSPFRPVDMVVVLSDQQTGKPILAVVIEPQGRDRKTKKVSWPVT
jgi:hypothetical protein